MPDIERQSALARSICARVCDARRSFDELRVIDRVLQGIERGADEYGPLDIARDGRIWDREAEQELRDLLFYLAAQFIAARDIERDRIEAEHYEAIASTPTPIEAGLAELANATEHDE